MNTIAFTDNLIRSTLIILSISFASCHHVQPENPHIIIKTKYGEIEAELYAKQAPKSVSAFISYIDSGYYTNSSFYRVLNDDNQPSNAPKAELIQGGIWRTNKKMAKTLRYIPHEGTNITGVHHEDGTLSLAREEPGTATTEFFICLGDQPGFDYGGENNPDGKGYAAFGKVRKGMDVIKKIYNAPEYNTSFDPPIMIYSVKKL